MQANTQNSNQRIFKDTEEYYEEKTHYTLLPVTESQRDDDAGDGGLTFQSQ